MFNGGFNFTPPIATFGASVDGIAEYTSSRVLLFREISLPPIFPPVRSIASNCHQVEQQSQALRPMPRDLSIR